MPNDVREMANEEIEAARREIRRHLIEFRERYIFPSDIDSVTLPMLDAVCAEVKRLKAEAVVMRELCEACEIVPKEEVQDVPDSRWKRWWDAYLAYRAMKGERDDK